LPPEAPPGTRLLALLGDPVAHSLSPRLHGAALAALRLDGAYLPLRCDARDLEGLLIGIARAGGAGNVTVPHKERAARLVEDALPAVRRTGACNTFWLEGGRVRGDNTDVPGFADALAAWQPGRGAERVLVLGAGGAAAAVLAALLERPGVRITLVNRTAERARALVARLDAADRVALAGLDTLRGERFDLVVNATSLGLLPGERPPFRFDGSIEVRSAFDLVYARGATDWVRDALSAGVPAIDGTEMLLRQAAHAFARWWRVAPPLDVMRRALDATVPAMEGPGPIA